MIEQIKIKQNTHTSDILFFQEVDLTVFDNHVVPLFGPNGVGKSTFIQAIIDNGTKKCQYLTLSLSDKPTTFYAYRNSTDNFKIAQPRSYEMAFDLRFLKMQWDAKSISEGQSVIYSIMELLDFALHRDDDGKDLAIVLDEIDSGLSIDNVDVVMRKIKHIVKRGDTQFIFSFNQPRVLKWFPHVLSMYDGTKLTLHTDDDMIREIRKHKKSFDRIRKTSKGMPKVYE